MSTDNRFTYHINPRSESVGGGYQLKLMENGQEVGGGVFPVTSDTSTDEAYLQASDAAEEWLQSRELDVDIAGANYGDLHDDVMIDIETAGKKPGAAVLSIGAVMFGAGGLGQSFYSPVLLQSCTDVGLTLDPETVAWWMKQSDEARAAAFVADAPRLSVVLLRFTDWFVAQKARYPWCHGATFDVPILDAAYEACGLSAPWKFYDVRDTRTLYGLAGVKVDRTMGTHHNALDDARAQAETAVKALNIVKAVDTQAAQDVLAERRRQVEAEDYDPEHDDEHVLGEIAAYAAYYAMPPGVREWPATETGYADTFGEAIVPDGWTPTPPDDRRRELVKAGALILAEIERLDRARVDTRKDAPK